MSLFAVRLNLFDFVADPFLLWGGGSGRLWLDSGKYQGQHKVTAKESIGLTRQRRMAMGEIFMAGDVVRQ